MWKTNRSISFPPFQIRQQIIDQHFSDLDLDTANQLEPELWPTSAPSVAQWTGQLTMATVTRDLALMMHKLEKVAQKVGNEKKTSAK